MGDMLQWAIGAFVVSILAGALGFTGVARGFATIAKILFVVFLVIAIIIVLVIILGIKAVT